MKYFVKNDKYYEFLPSALEIAETPSSPKANVLLWTIISFIILAVVWSILGKTDEIAISRGKIASYNKANEVLSLQAGTISKVIFKEGDKVSKGQILAELESPVLKSELETLQNSLAIYTLQRDISRAEANGQSIYNVIDNSNVNQDVKDDLESLVLSKASASDVQQSLISKQIGASRESASNLSKQTSDLQSQIDSITDANNELRSQIDSEKDDSVKAQLTTKYNNNLNQIKMLDSQKGSLVSKSSSLQGDISALSSNLAQAKSQTNTEKFSAIVELDTKITSLNSELKKANDVIGQLKVVAPIDGIVQESNISGNGAQITAGQKLLSIVPVSSDLIVESMIQNNDIGFVKTGQDVQIKIDTYPFQRYGLAKGKVISLSPDSINDKDGKSTYKAQISLQKQSSALTIKPGMTVTAEISTGKKRIVDFFLDPLSKKVDESLKLR